MTPSQVQAQIKYRSTHRGMLAERARKYREKNPEKARLCNKKCSKAYRDLNRQTLAEKKKQYMKSARAKDLANLRNKKYEEKHKDKVLARKADYRKTNRDRLVLEHRGYRELTLETYLRGFFPKDLRMHLTEEVIEAKRLHLTMKRCLRALVGGDKRKAKLVMMSALVGQLKDEAKRNANDNR